MVKKEIDFDFFFIVEMYNFFLGVVLYLGVEMGIGGRIRDTYVTGCGFIFVVGIVGYMMGNLCLDGKIFFYEDIMVVYLFNLVFLL